MHTVGQIIRQRREQRDMTLAILADKVDTTKGYLSMIENHRVANPPSRKLLERLERALGLKAGELRQAADWQNTPPEVRQQMNQLQEKVEQGEQLAKWLKEKTAPRRKAGAGRDLDKAFKTGELSRRINAMLGTTAKRGKKKSKSTKGGRSRSGSGVGAIAPVSKRIPLINKVAAGYPSDFTDLDYPARVADSYVASPDVMDADAFAATVVGDSMIPDYREGDIVIFSPAADVSAGSDCFVRLEPDHESTFKRVFFETKGQIRLQPLNPEFPARTLPREHVAGLYKAVARYQML